jgi:hypothetical protein
MSSKWEEERERKRRKLHKILFFYWVIPGLPISLYFRQSVTYLVVISVYTIAIEHLLGWNPHFHHLTRKLKRFIKVFRKEG